MNILFWGFLYLIAHMLIYVVFLRGLSGMRNEKGIFFYHLFSMILIVSTTILFSIPYGWREGVTVTIAIVAAHGIYSISFLELWSLTQGSFSFQVLRAIDHESGIAAEYIIDSLSSVGDQKKNQRIQSLVGLGLLEKNGDMAFLTNRGRNAAIFLRMLQWIPNLRDTG